MSATTSALSRDPRSRYDGGFDRWNRDSRSGWSVLWRASEHASFALGDSGSVWVWDARDRIWTRLPSDEAAMVLREHVRAMNRLRRALLVVRLLNSETEVDREAARLALERIGQAIVAEWQEGRSADDLKRGAGWFDHPAAVFLAVTRDCRFHFAERERVPFDSRVFDDLFASAQDDFKAGRRSQPPRLRPEDMAHCQSHMASPVQNTGMEPAPAAPEPMPSEARKPPPSPAPPEPDHIGQLLGQLREDLTHELLREDGARADQKMRRRQIFLVSGSLAACLAAIMAIASVS